MFLAMLFISLDYFSNHNSLKFQCFWLSDCESKQDASAGERRDNWATQSGCRRSYSDEIWRCQLPNSRLWRFVLAFKQFVFNIRDFFRSRYGAYQRNVLNSSVFERMSHRDAGHHQKTQVRRYIGFCLPKKLYHRLVEAHFHTLFEFQSLELHSKAI
jgi:hypothetical protein